MDASSTSQTHNFQEMHIVPLAIQRRLPFFTNHWLVVLTDNFTVLHSLLRRSGAQTVPNTAPGTALDTALDIALKIKLEMAPEMAPNTMPEMAPSRHPRWRLKQHPKQHTRRRETTRSHE